MLKLSRWTLVLALLALAGTAAAEETAVAPALDSIAVQPAEVMAPRVTVEPAEAEAALVVDGEVETIAATCSFCPFTIGYPQCPQGTPVGYECSAPIYNCSCGFCNGLFGCLRP